MHRVIALSTDKSCSNDPTLLLDDNPTLVLDQAASLLVATGVATNDLVATWSVFAPFKLVGSWLLHISPMPLPILPTPKKVQLLWKATEPPKETWVQPISIPLLDTEATKQHVEQLAYAIDSFSHHPKHPHNAVAFVPSSTNTLLLSLLSLYLASPVVPFGTPDALPCYVDVTDTLQVPNHYWTRFLVGGHDRRYLDSHFQNVFATSRDSIMGLGCRFNSPLLFTLPESLTWTND